jgi:hypothetical protein
MKQTLTVSQETFISMLPGLIASGVLFKATEKGGEIIVVFTGGY